MKTYIAFFLLLLAMSSSAKEMEFLNFGDKEFDKLKKEKSKWFVKFGLDYINYQSTFPEFDGQHETIKENEKEDVFGYGLGVGREFYLGAGFSSSLTIGALYSKTLYKRVAEAAEDIDIVVANTRRGYQIINYEALLSLNYLIDFKYVDVQPFIEGGLGVGSVEVEKQYYREPVEGASAAEEYDITTKEKIAYSKATIGLNCIAMDGISSYIKLTSIVVNISERKTTGVTNAFGSLSNVNIDRDEKSLSENKVMTMASVGLGYAF